MAEATTNKNFLAYLIDFFDAFDWGDFCDVFVRGRPNAVPSPDPFQTSTNACAERITVSTACADGSLR